MQSVLAEIRYHIEGSDDRYGGFTSTHEALSVCSEEWDELRKAIHENVLENVRSECIDLAAALIRLAVACRDSEAMRKRSVK